MKNWKQSKFVWFGILWLIVGVASLFGFKDFVPSSLWNELGTILNGLIIVWLRYKTNTGITK